MKKLLILAICLALPILGCCTRTAPDGTVTKSFSNCIKAADEMVCNPPATVQSIAAVAAPLLATLLNVLVPASSEWVNANNAYTVALSIQSGICVGGGQLANFIAFLESNVFQKWQESVETTAAAKKMVREITAGDIVILKAWAGK